MMQCIIAVKPEMRLKQQDYDELSRWGAGIDWAELYSSGP